MESLCRPGSVWSSAAAAKAPEHAWLGNVWNKMRDQHVYLLSRHFQDGYRKPNKQKGMSCLQSKGRGGSRRTGCSCAYWWMTLRFRARLHTPSLWKCSVHLAQTDRCSSCLLLLLERDLITQLGWSWSRVKIWILNILLSPSFLAQNKQCITAAGKQHDKNLKTLQESVSSPDSWP